MQPMHEEELDHFLSLTLRDEAAAHEARLANVEEKIMERLRPAPSARPLPALRWGWVAAGAMACLAIGLALGYLLKPTEPGAITLATYKCGPVFDNNITYCDFTVFDPKAKSVALTGSFTEWARVALSQKPDQPGIWTGTFSIQGASQRFAFVIDDQNWKIYQGCPKTIEFLGRQECVLNL